MIENQIIIAWLAFGVLLFATELLIPGLGLMFAGFGALTTGMLLNFSIIPDNNHLFQAVIFLGSSAAWTFLLWNPLKKARFGKKRISYNNIVGEFATVGEKGIDKENGGDVKWSGTIMRAKLSPNTDVEYLQSGENVRIEAVSGNILIVTPNA